MNPRKQFVVAHPPFWHIGSSVPERSHHTGLAALPAVVAGFALWGLPAFAVTAVAVATAILWELAINRVSGKAVTIGDGNAALIGLLLAMMLPASAPWWMVLTGTFLAVVVGKQIFGGIGGNSFNPAVLAVAILAVSWPHLFDFDAALVDYDLDFVMVYPPAAAKHFGTAAVRDIPVADLLLGRQVGGIGTTCGLGLIAGGAYLILRGFVRWEIPVSFLAGIAAAALVFNLIDPGRYAPPLFHLLTGYTLFGAFFLATEDSSSPVHFIPMLLYGAFGGVLTILIRNIGAFEDGVVYAVLVINLLQPLIDKIRPKALGKVF